ncbi:hypothetical protein Tco_1270414 [Tanacetum coccineum]
MTEKLRVVLSSVVGVEEGKSVADEGGISVLTEVIEDEVLANEISVVRVVIAAMVFTQTPTRLLSYDNEMENMVFFYTEQGLMDYTCRILVIFNIMQELEREVGWKVSRERK